MSNKKPNMSSRQRSTIRAATRRICRAEGIGGKELSEQSGISHAAACKMLSKPSSASHTKTINSDTAGMLELWMADRAKAGKDNNPQRASMTPVSTAAGPTRIKDVAEKQLTLDIKDPVPTVPSEGKDELFHDGKYWVPAPEGKVWPTFLQWYAKTYSWDKEQGWSDPMHDMEKAWNASKRPSKLKTIVDRELHEKMVDRLEKEIKAKDLAIADLSRMNGSLNRRVNEYDHKAPGYMDARKETIELQRKYDALTHYAMLLLAGEHNAKS